MKYLIILIAMSYNLLAQGVILGAGYDANKMFNIGFGFISNNNVDAKMNFNIAMLTEEKGKYYSTINWDEFPEDTKEQGSYYSTYDVSVGYVIRYEVCSIIVNGVIGYSTQTLYRNQYDDFHILGENGDYYINKSGNSDFNYGIEVGYFRNNFGINLLYTKYTGIGINFNLYITDNKNIKK